MIRRSRFASALVVGTVLTALVAGSAAAAPTPRVLHPMGIRHPSRMVAVQRGVVTGHSTWVGPGRTLRLAGAATAEIVIDYHGSAWTVASKAAFESAVAYWSQTLTSSVPIVVSATFKSLPGTTLGQAGPSEMRENFSVNAQADTLYPIALANAIAGIDLNGPDQASGTVYCRAEHEDRGRWIVMAICYVDRYRRVDRRWYFDERLVKHWYACDVLERPHGPNFQAWEGHEHHQPELPQLFDSWGAFWSNTTEQRDELTAWP